MSDAGAGQATDQIAAEKAAGNNTNGVVALVWTNGPDFYAERSQNLLYGPFAQSLPNAQNFDFTSQAIATDFGQPTAGYEFPYNSAQITFIYQPDCVVGQPPQSMAALVDWVLSNPGKFTYANPGGLNGDYTGSAFIRHFLYEFGPGGYKALQGGYSASAYAAAATPAFAQLRAMAPGIYQLPGGTPGPYYPDNQTAVDNLFAVGDICINLSYDPDHVGQLIHTTQEPGVLNWPNTTRAYIPSSGTIGNVNFVAISYNAASLFGALVVANFIGSMGAQYSRRSIDPPGIGTVQAFNPTCQAMIQGGWSVPFATVPSFPETPTPAQLAAGFLPEVDARYATQMQIDWVYCVQQNLTTASGPGGSGIPCF